MRFEVRGTEGVPIAVWVDGEGPPLVMVHGMLSDHATFQPMVAAMGAAAMSRNVSPLIAYEPGLFASYPEGAIDGIEAALARGDAEHATVTLLAQVLGLDEPAIDALRAAPQWPARLAASPTLPRECRAERDWMYRPGAFDGVTARTLVLQGSDSGEDLVATTRARPWRLSRGPSCGSSPATDTWRTAPTRAW